MGTVVQFQLRPRISVEVKKDNNAPYVITYGEKKKLIVICVLAGFSAGLLCTDFVGLF